MPNDKSNETKQRTRVEDLPREEQELSAEEQKQVQGGATRLVTRPTSGTGASGGGSGEDEESYSIWPADREN